jgi:hypothetical protein
MNQILLEKIQGLIEEEVRIQINRYAQIISKRHDISLKLLLRDIELLTSTKEVSTRCLGITGKRTQCLAMGKYDGYCSRHVIQRKVPVVVVPPVTNTSVPTLQESFAIEKPKPKLMIEI